MIWRFSVKRRLLVFILWLLSRGSMSTIVVSIVSCGNGGYQRRVFVILGCTFVALYLLNFDGKVPFLPSRPLVPPLTTVLLISSCVCNKHPPSAYNERQTNKDKISLQSVSMLAQVGRRSRIKILCKINQDIMHHTGRQCMSCLIS